MTKLSNFIGQSAVWPLLHWALSKQRGAWKYKIFHDAEGQIVECELWIVMPIMVYSNADRFRYTRSDIWEEPGHHLHVNVSQVHHFVICKILMGLEGVATQLSAMVCPT